MNDDVVNKIEKTNGDIEIAKDLFGSIENASERKFILKSLFKHRSPFVKVAALALIAPEEVREFIPEITFNAYDRHSFVRHAAAKAFSRDNSSLPVDVLSDGLRDVDSVVQKAYCELLELQRHN